MKPKHLLALVLSAVLTGCVVTPTKPPDIRATLLESDRHSEPDFPDGRDLVLTHFSHVGQLVTSRGDIIYVADQHSVTAAALSPHGQRFIVFFDKQFRYLGKIGYYGSYPLWCDGSKLFLYGDLHREFFNPRLDRKTERFLSGNVIDVAYGFENLRVYHARVYGSSGGLQDKFDFDSICMIDRQVGWAQNARAVFLTNDWVFNDKAIWRTTNGGQSWHQVLCASPAETGTISAFFRDSKTAWVAAADESTNVTIFRTSDGGVSWSRSQLRQSHLIQDSCLSFTGTDQGWLMLIPDHGMNSSPGDLYRTRDRGARWRLVNSTAKPGNSFIWEQATEPEFQKRHPFLVCGGAIAFRNDSTGWVRGSLASTTPRILFISRDAGLSWQVQHLALPPSLQSGHMEPAGLPQFFRPASHDGILPAEYCPTNSDAASFATVIYSTHDGGASWQPTTPVKFSGTWSFITASKGWIWTPEPHDTGSTAPVKGTLYRTDDSGVSWNPAGTGKSLEQYLSHGEDIVQLDFVDGEYGWAIARDGHNLTQLLQTTDGGGTWGAIQTMMQP